MRYYLDGGFGDVGDDEPWRYVLAPRTVLSSSKYSYNGNQVVDPIKFFPKPYFTVPFVSGTYKVAVISDWLKSIGVNPAPYIASSADTYSLLSGRAWGTAPGPIIKGTDLGLCLWPPVQFLNQQHVLAWLAYWKAYRNYLEPSCMSTWEVAGIGGASPNFSTNAIARLRDQTLNQWDSFEDGWTEFLQNAADAGSDFSNREDYRYRYLVPRLIYGDPELQAKVMVLYTLACAHMAFKMADYNDCRLSNDHPAFPGRKALPYIQDVETGSFLDVVFPALASLVAGFVTGGAGAVAISAATTFTKLAQKGSGSASFANVNLPSDPSWKAVSVPLAEFANWPTGVSAGTSPFQITATIAPWAHDLLLCTSLKDKAACHRLDVQGCARGGQAACARLKAAKTRPAAASSPAAAAGLDFGTLALYGLGAYFGIKLLSDVLAGTSRRGPR